MPTANARKGAETERMVVQYLKHEAFAGAERRLREGRRDDQGDIDGVPLTTIQVKYVAQPRIQSWITATLKQRDNAGNPLCLLIRRLPHKPVEQWEASMPTPGFDEKEAWTWTRMDLRLAVELLSTKIRAEQHSRWVQSLGDMSMDSTLIEPVTEESSSVPSTEKETPPSPMT